MRYRKRPPLTSRDIVVLVGIGLAGLAVAAAQVGADIQLSSLAPGGGGFFSPWAGARAFLLQDGDPYGVRIAIRAQELAHREAPPNSASSYGLNLPFFLLPLFFPFALMQDPAVARGVWVFLCQLGMVGTIFLSMRVIGWSARRASLVALSFLGVFSFYPVAALADGTPAALLALGYVSILWAIQSERDELAGALMVLCLSMWEVGLPFLILLAWRVFHERRWRILAGFSMTLAILLPISFLLYPGWLLPFLTASVGVLRSPHGISTSAILLRFSPQYGAQIAEGVTIVTVSMLLYEWAAGRDSDDRRFVWTACLALAATPLLGLRTEPGNLVVLMPGVVLIAASAFQRTRSGALLGGIVVALTFAVPWIFFWRWFALHDQRAYDLLFLFLPVICLIGLYWTRWWFLRPTRTWLDEVRAVGR
ncbi:MAG: hypothetical protein V1755_15845 [Chloroflexota bacterium]